MVTTDFLTKAMQVAAAEGRLWMGATSPNPPVGAVALDAAGNVLAIAAHQHAGESHAEVLLLQACREKNVMGLVDSFCVTLEPCNHHGHTPPCTEAIIQAGIKRVVIGTRDPNPQVKGGGVEALRAAGIEVITDMAADECGQLFHAFAYRAKTGKPWLTVKRALTREGSMIPPAGQTTFTSPDSLLFAHRLRKKADAIITGSGTILADHPQFTVRHVHDHVGKRRWLGILDRRGRIGADIIADYKMRGLDAMIYRDIDEALHDLTARGAQDILAEAGPALSESLLDSGLWTMSVTIRQGESDDIGVEFNPTCPLPFASTSFNWEAFLPQEKL